MAMTLWGEGGLQHNVTMTLLWKKIVWRRPLSKKCRSMSLWYLHEEEMTATVCLTESLACNWRSWEGDSSMALTVTTLMGSAQLESVS